MNTTTVVSLIKQFLSYQKLSDGIMSLPSRVVTYVAEKMGLPHGAPTVTILQNKMLLGNS